MATSRGAAPLILYHLLNKHRTPTYLSEENKIFFSSILNSPGADNGMRARTESLEGFNATITPYLHISWRRGFPPSHFPSEAIYLAVNRTPTDSKLIFYGYLLNLQSIITGDAPLTAHALIYATICP